MTGKVRLVPLQFMSGFAWLVKLMTG